MCFRARFSLTVIASSCITRPIQESWGGGKRDVSSPPCLLSPRCGFAAHRALTRCLDGVRPADNWRQFNIGFAMSCSRVRPRAKQECAWA